MVFNYLFPAKKISLSFLFSLASCTFLQRCRYSDIVYITDIMNWILYSIYRGSLSRTWVNFTADLELAWLYLNIWHCTKDRCRRLHEKFDFTFLLKNFADFFIRTDDQRFIIYCSVIFWLTLYVYRAFSIQLGTKPQTRTSCTRWSKQRENPKIFQDLSMEELDVGTHTETDTSVLFPVSH